MRCGSRRWLHTSTSTTTSLCGVTRYRLMERTDTTQRLEMLRSLMRERNLAAYIVPSDDAHMSEYIHPRYERRAFISGFTGSAGTAVVPLEGKAALWTDGRYYLQASKELDDNWILMKDRLPGTKPVETWLIETLAPKSAVGIDPALFSVSLARRYRRVFEGAKADHHLVSISENLVDLVWGADQPTPPSEKAMAHPIEYSGEDSSSKIETIRKKMQQKQADAFVISALDEVMWTFNIRGSDVPYNPVLMSFGLITHENAYLYTDEAKVDEEVRRHLGRVKVLPYSQIFEDLRALDKENKQVWFDPSKSSLALADCMQSVNAIEERSPVELPKALKNPVELEGLRQAHLRDAAALVSFAAWLEQELEKGAPHTEITAAEKLTQFRSEQKDFISLSFETISSSGPNAAVIHYSPSPKLCASVTKDKIFLLDSGGQYRDGTTDVTRTFHFGTPSAHEKRCFTRVLQGHIHLALSVFPEGTTGHKLDILARLPLWQDGLDYFHGTGHGVGAFLNVHEGPQGIGSRETPTATPLQPGMTVTNEPGYYEDGAFGIRIENVMAVKEAKTPGQFPKGQRYLDFEQITFVPIQKNLMDLALLSPDEIRYLNEAEVFSSEYHKTCWEKVSPLLSGAALKWLQDATSPIYV